MSKETVDPLLSLMVHKGRKKVKIYSNYIFKIQNEFTFGLWKKKNSKKNEERHPFTKFGGP